MADNTSQVKQAEAILHAQDYLQILRTRWKEALFVFLLVFVSCAVITKLSTPMYTSSMRIEIKPRVRRLILLPVVEQKARFVLMRPVRST